MLNYVELNEMLKELLYLNRLSTYLKDNGLTIESATTEDFYGFIGKEESGKIDYYTGKPVTNVNYSAGMDKIQDLVCKYRKLKTALEYLMENNCL